MENLSINDKTAILNINSIEENSILWENRRIIIFEYFAKFEESFLFQKVKTLGFNFQIKIQKELFKNCEEDFLKSKYIILILKLPLIMVSLIFVLPIQQ